MKDLSSSSRRDHMANERTFLAWIRTSIGIMAFGFVVEKFSLFVKQITYFLAVQGVDQSQELFDQHHAYSSVFGIFLVGLGSLIGFFSFIKYRKIHKEIEANEYNYSETMAFALTTLVVAMGCFLVVYLIKT